MAILISFLVGLWIIGLLIWALLNWIPSGNGAVTHTEKPLKRT